MGQIVTIDDALDLCRRGAESMEVMAKDSQDITAVRHYERLADIYVWMESRLREWRQYQAVGHTLSDLRAAPGFERGARADGAPPPPSQSMTPRGK